jgi:uncharacterized protein YlzI (FlbEa/FlbD family)
MIEVTRLNGTPMILNSDLIKIAESSPDTMLTLIQGEKLIVRESCAEIVEKVLAYRAQLLAEVAMLTGSARPASRRGHVRRGHHQLLRLEPSGRYPRSEDLTMDKASFGGVILAVVGILAGLLLEGGNLGQIFQPTAAMIVFGGTLGAVLLQFPLHTVVEAFPAAGCRSSSVPRNRTCN